MKLYLVQHGLSKPKEEDPDRRLTEKGKEATEKVALYASENAKMKVSTIYHSGKARAKETAEIMAEHLRPEEGVQVTKQLAPMDDPSIWRDKLKDLKEDIMLVGHLPYMSRLASLLLFGNSDKKTINFKNSGIVCLKRDDDECWSVEWMIIPEIV